VLAEWPEPERQRLRPRIEHAQLVHPDDRVRFGELGVVASMQPVHAVSDWRQAWDLWGERTRDAYAWRALAEAGAPLAFGSDVPVEPIDPRLGLAAAVAGGDLEGPEGVAFLRERAHGIDAAFAGF